MPSKLIYFETIVRKAYQFTDSSSTDRGGIHPFGVRNIHDKLPLIVKKLFDDGHYTQATFEAFKFVDKEVQRISGASTFGTKLMLTVFEGTNPRVRLSDLSNKTKRGEQAGYRFLFSGAMLAIRNPRGHEYDLGDDLDTCLDHLVLASLLLRRLEEAGYPIGKIK